MNQWTAEESGRYYENLATVVDGMATEVARNVMGVKFVSYVLFTGSRTMGRHVVQLRLEAVITHSANRI